MSTALSSCANRSRTLHTSLGAMTAVACADGLRRLEFTELHEPAQRRRDNDAQHESEVSELLDRVEAQLREYFAGERTRFSIPLDFDGTPFQRRVWQTLLTIPHGETLSYGELAETLECPGGSRAVGRANGANQIAIIVPCHRVIRSGGDLGGYGGGLQRKQWLLNHESRDALFAS